MEPLELRNKEFVETRDYNSKISFIGVISSFGRKLDSSIESIDNIAQDLGNDYEIILTNISDSSLPADKRKDYSELYPNLHIIEDRKGNFGHGKEIAYRNSDGRFIVPFCTDISYPVAYADMIHGFLGMRIKRLFYSELSLINREFIDQVGGWRDLSNGEDIDLYSRLAVNYGVFAFPTLLLKLDEVMRNELLSIRFVGTRELGYGTAIRMLRDLIISCNYSLSDMKELRKIGKRMSKNYMKNSTVAYILAKFAATKPNRYSKNNFLILFESILESVVLKEYLKISELSIDASLELDRVHLIYLKNKSKLFSDLESSVSNLFVS